MMKILLSTLLVLCMTGAVVAQDNTESFFKSKTYVKNPLELRDPFKRRLNKKKTLQSQSKTKNQMLGIYTNQSNSIENKPIESIRIIGVVLGNERRAIAKIADETPDASGDPVTYYIKEGMHIGENGAEVKAILPGGIILVEKIRNVYDQDEYLETVIPVSND